MKTASGPSIWAAVGSESETRLRLATGAVGDVLVPTGEERERAQRLKAEQELATLLLELERTHALIAKSKPRSR
jgi:hypothetical protein